MPDFLPRLLASQAAPDFPAGGGEMGQRIRGHEWSRTPLGDARGWPQGLRTAVRIMLASRQPTSIWWGADLSVLYNDACRELIGGNHPSALGQPAAAAWREIWEDIGPRVEGAIRGDGQGAADPMPLLLERQGRVEEAHYTITFTAMPGDAASAGGLLCGFTDVSRSVVLGRQMNVLHAVALRTAGAAAAEDACKRAAEALAGSVDIPFAALYLVNERAGEARLAASTGIARGHVALPERQSLGDGGPWPFAGTLAGAGYQSVSLGESAFGSLPSGPWSRPPREAAVVRLGGAGSGGTRAILVAALNPFRAHADNPRRFVELIAAQLKLSGR